MPGRQSNAFLTAASSNKRKRTKPRALNALAIAEHQNPQKIRIQGHRLGESEDHRKRRKTVEEDPNDQHARRESPHAATELRSSDDGGSDSEGNEWRLGEVDKDDDSDLDSDAAFGDSDQDKLDGFVFRGSSTFQAARQKPKYSAAGSLPKKDDDGDVEQDRYCVIEDDFGDEGVDLATALDMNMEDEDGVPSAERQRRAIESRSEGLHEELEDDGSDESDASETGQSEFSLSEAENNPEGLSKLRGFVNTINGETVDSNMDTTRQLSTQEYEKPSDFGLRSLRKITVEDLMPSITDSRLKRSLKLMNSGETTGATKRSGIPGKLAPPLPKRQQDKLDRSAAYEKSKETLGRWIDTVKESRRSEHIAFPLPDPDIQSRPGTKQLLPATSSKPVTGLESTIQNILQESGMAPKENTDADAQIQILEGLETRKIPLEEIRARQAELRKARDLLFREEIRARRINKIKSKSFRRVHRKARDKVAQQERQALMAAGVDLSDEEREKSDRRRAEERMGGRYRESRWARSVKDSGRAAWDEDARTGVVDLARRDDELRRRIEGRRVAVDEEDELEPTTSESDDESLRGEAEWYGDDHYLQNNIGRLAEAGQNGDYNESDPRVGLHSMKFMKKAEASRRAENDAEIQDMLRSLSNNGDGTLRDGSPQVGRQKYGMVATDEPSASTERRSPKEDLDELRSSHDEVDEGDDLDPGVTILSEKQSRDAADHTQTSTKTPAGHARVAGPDHRRTDGKGESNPWIVQPRSDHREMSQPGRGGDVVNPWLSGEKPKSRRDKASESATVTNKPLSVQSKTSSAKGQAKVSKTPSILPDGGDLSETEGDGNISAVPSMDHPLLLSKPDLVKMAFAGDDRLIEDFEREKHETVEDEGDKIVDNALPGWGSWTGAGISKKEQKRNRGRFVTKVEGVQQDKRKDAKLERVIINEKRVKKNARYLASELPHPFESRQQYERSLRLPVGPEWSTKSTFQDATKPRVLIKQGVIRPIDRPTA